MTYAFVNQDLRKDRYKRRAKRARSLARFLMFCLICTTGAAIWQDRALAPPIHDKMQEGFVLAMEKIEQSETASAYLTTITNYFGGTSTSSQRFDPLGDALAKLRN